MPRYQNEHPIGFQLLAVAAAVILFAVAFFGFVAKGAEAPYLNGYPPVQVPGVANPAVNQANIHKTVCVAGWTKTVRPPASYTNKLKLSQLKEWGWTLKPSEAEEDHFWPIEGGGNPTDPRNLWPMAYAGKYGARVKDQVENALHRLLCADKMTLAQVGRCITSDWIECGRKIGVIK